MKKTLLIALSVIVLAITLTFISCRRSDEPQPGAASNSGAPAVNTASPEIDPTPAETAAPTDIPEITSAVEFLSCPGVISKDDTSAKRTKDPETLKPGEIYVGGTANDRAGKYDLLILDREQSLKLLTASDLTRISYQQSECLPLMLRWDDISVLDMYWYYKNYKTRACRAYYYYLEDSTVIIVNDAVRVYRLNLEYDKPWILVIPKEDEAKYAAWIPPKGTITGQDELRSVLYAPYYDCIRNYFLSDPELPAREGLIEPENTEYMRSYEEWIKWRAVYPEYYEEWKQLSFPDKATRENGLTDSPFRCGYLEWAGIYAGDHEPFDPDSLFSNNLPEIYNQIKAYNIPKEEMLEYVKWMKWSRAFQQLALNEDDVELLYSGDEDAIRQSLMIKKAIYFEGRIYMKWDIMNWVPAYDLARMYTKEQFTDIFKDDITHALNLLDEGNLEGRERLNRILGAWDTYDKISKEDSGALTVSSATRVLKDFMDFYKEVKYSPDTLAGELASSYDPNLFSYDEEARARHISHKSFDELREEICNIFSSEICTELRAFGDGWETSFYGRQFFYTPWDGFENMYFVSALPRYYDGPIELFDDSYLLEEHIRIESGDGEHASAVLTARDRSGDGEKTYSVEFSKVGGRWLISGGTLLDIIKPVD